MLTMDKLFSDAIRLPSVHYKGLRRSMKFDSWLGLYNINVTFCDFANIFVCLIFYQSDVVIYLNVLTFVRLTAKIIKYLNFVVCYFSLVPFKCHSSPFDRWVLQKLPSLSYFALVPDTHETSVGVMTILTITNALVVKQWNMTLIFLTSGMMQLLLFFVFGSSYSCTYMFLHYQHT